MRLARTSTQGYIPQLSYTYVMVDLISFQTCFYSRICWLVEYTYSSRMTRPHDQPGYSKLGCTLPCSTLRVKLLVILQLSKFRPTKGKFPRGPIFGGHYGDPIWLWTSLLATSPFLRSLCWHPELPRANCLKFLSMDIPKITMTSTQTSQVPYLPAWWAR